MGGGGGEGRGGASLLGQGRAGQGRAGATRVWCKDLGKLAKLHLLMRS